MVIEGIPIMMLEFAIGQKMRMSSWRVWPNVSPALSGLGLASVIVSLTVCCYYMVVIAWCFYYFFISFQKNLPWQLEELCPKYESYQNLKNQVEFWQKNYTSYNNQTIFANISKENYESKKSELEGFSSCCVIDPPQWYFYSNVLEISTDIEDYSVGLNGKLVGCLIVAWVVVYLCVAKGIKSSGKVRYPSFAIQDVQSQMKTFLFVNIVVPRTMFCRPLKFLTKWCISCSLGTTKACQELNLT
jgi:SNF family Na+-dependent transporter